MNLYYKFPLALLLFTFPSFIYCQKISGNSKNYHKEFYLTSENDAYCLQGKDYYYTDGIYFGFCYVTDPKKFKWLKKTIIKKMINTFELRQDIYTPRSGSVQALEDRPFTGYLALTFNKYIFSQKNNLVELGTSIGTIGPNALGKDLQTTYHSIFGFYNVEGWDTQLRNELSLNFNALLLKPIIKGSKEKRFFNLDGYTKAQLGNAFTNISLGGLLRLGSAENNWNSSHWRARISRTNDAAPVLDHELYFFYEPLVTLQAYNATIQGGMFIKNKGPVTGDIKPFVFTNQIGIRYAENRWTTALIYIAKSKEAARQIENDKFCSIQLVYLFN